MTSPPQEEALPTASSSGSPVEEEGLPPASRGQVFWACTQTSLVLGGVALLLRSIAGELGPAALHTDAAQVLRLLAGVPQLLACLVCASCNNLGPTVMLRAAHTGSLWHVPAQCQTGWSWAMRQRCWLARGR